jgi:hypothetical protein
MRSSMIYIHTLHGKEGQKAVDALDRSIMVD